MIDRDAHGGALNTTPSYRHQFGRSAPNCASNQILILWPCLLHNHPSGDPTPSRADIQMTQAIVEIAKPLGIDVHDHIIVGKDGHASLKGLKLI